jgi:hypothetical protein
MRHLLLNASSCTTFVVLIAMSMQIILPWDVAHCRVSFFRVKQAKKI